MEGDRREQVLDYESERAARGAPAEGPEADDLNAVDELAPGLPGRPWRVDRHTVAGTDQRHGLGGHAHILRVWIVLEQHRDPLACLTRHPSYPSPPLSLGFLPDE
jgi:hypothetical protein